MKMKIYGEKINYLKPRYCLIFPIYGPPLRWVLRKSIWTQNTGKIELFFISLGIYIQVSLTPNWRVFVIPYSERNKKQIDF